MPILLDVVGIILFNNFYETQIMLNTQQWDKQYDCNDTKVGIVFGFDHYPLDLTSTCITSTFWKENLCIHSNALADDKNIFKIKTDKV